MVRRSTFFTRHTAINLCSFVRLDARTEWKLRPACQIFSEKNIFCRVVARGSLGKRLEVGRIHPKERGNTGFVAFPVGRALAWELAGGEGSQSLSWLSRLLLDLMRMGRLFERATACDGGIWGIGKILANVPWWSRAAFCTLLHLSW